MKEKSNCNNIILSTNITSIKFFLTIAVVFIHSYSLVESDNNFLNSIKLFFSFIIPRVAVPMFYLYAGYLFFKGEKFSYTNYCNKIKKRIFSLGVPYILWGTIAFIMACFTEKNLFYNLNSIQSVIISILWSYPNEAFSQLQWIGYEIPIFTPINTPLWFIRDLLLLCLISPIIYLIIKRKVIGLWSLILLSLIFLFVNTEQLPLLGIDNLYFFMIGSYISYHKIHLFNIRIKTIIGILVVISSLSAYKFYNFENLSVISRHIYILVGIIFLIQITNEIKLPIKIGQKNISNLPVILFFIYCSHIIIIRFFVKITYRLCLFLPEPLKIILYFISPLVVCIICFILFRIMDTYTPNFLRILTGNRKK